MPKKTGKPYIYLRKDGRYEGRYKKWIVKPQKLSVKQVSSAPVKNEAEFLKEGDSVFSSQDRKYRYVSVYGATYEEAYEKVLRGMACEKMLTEGNLSVSELMENWLVEIQKTMKPSSYALYRNYAEKYILPKTGKRCANTFDESALSAVLESIRMGTDGGAPLAVNTVYIMEEIIRAAFRYGAEKKLIPEINFGRVKYRPQNVREVNPLSELEIQQLLSVLKQQETEVQIQVMLPLYAGLSLSELCGLKWEDVNLELGRIHIHRNLKRIQQNTATEESSCHNPKGKSGKKEDRGKRKTATAMAEYELQESECREFEMPGIVWKLLRDAADLSAERKNTETKYYIASLNAKYPEGRTLQYRLKAIGLQAGMDGLNFRMLRDTFAVMCLQAGGDIYNLAYVLGIAVSAACERYGDWIARDEGFLKRIG